MSTLTDVSTEPTLYMNGDYLPLSAARISTLDQGFLLSDGIFDVVSAWQGVIFKLEEHLDRFFDSVRAARLVTRLTRKYKKYKWGVGSNWSSRKWSWRHEIMDASSGSACG